MDKRNKYLQVMLTKGLVNDVKNKNKQTADANKYPQGYFKPKKCKHCSKEFIPQAPSEHYCSDFCRRYEHVNNYYKRAYNITINEYLDLAEKQNFKCALCGNENFAMGDVHSGVLVVDHNHKTGNVRGLLCHNCNRALGLLRDNETTISKIVPYLEGATTISQESTTQVNGVGKIQP